MSSSKVVINHEGVTRGHSGEGVEINSKIVTVTGKLMVAGMDVAEKLEVLAKELQKLIEAQAPLPQTLEDKVQIPEMVQPEVAKEETVAESADSSDKEEIESDDQPSAEETPTPATTKKTGRVSKVQKPAEPQAE
jgi:hypothetical protein